MALSEETQYDKIEVVTEYKHVQVRKALVIKKDGAEISRTFKRYVLHSGTISGSDNTWADTNISGEPAEVQAICNAAWTQAVKDKYKALLISQK
jgi:hypothetical protein